MPAESRVRPAPRLRDLLPILALLPAALAGPPSCSGTQPADVPGAAAPDLPQRLILTGELQAVQSRDITAPRTEVWPIQIRWMVPEGTEVAAGQEVVQIDNSAVASKMEEQRVAFIEAGIRLRSREAELEALRAEHEFEQERTRIELEKAEVRARVPPEMLSKRDHEERRIALERAKAAAEKAERALEAFEASAAADLDVLRVELTKAERNITRAQEILSELTLRAPRAGVLVYAEHPWMGRKIDVGDNVWPGLTIVKIPDLSRMQVLAWLSDVDDGAATVGQEAVCTLDTYADRTYTGRIVDILGLAEERGRATGVRAFRVTVALDRSDPAIMRPGMSVKVELERSTG